MDTTALFKLSYGLYVVGVRNGNGFGGCIVDAVAQVSMGDVPTIIVGSMKRNLTNELIKKEKEFSLSILSKGVDPFVIGNFGFQSSRNVDKWSNVPHTLTDGFPYLDGSVAEIKLKMTEAKELDTHTVFFCEVQDARLGNTSDDPLIYGDYQKSMKDLTMEAFKKFKESR
jgi:flavin reductase (DIM6/NTAB) family NADH-FMN oxidoreductase RutF